MRRIKSQIFVDINVEGDWKLVDRNGDLLKSRLESRSDCNYSYAAISIHLFREEENEEESEEEYEASNDNMWSVNIATLALIAAFSENGWGTQSQGSGEAQYIQEMFRRGVGVCCHSAASMSVSHPLQETLNLVANATDDDDYYKYQNLASIIMQRQDKNTKGDSENCNEEYRNQRVARKIIAPTFLQTHLTSTLEEKYTQAKLQDYQWRKAEEARQEQRLDGNLPTKEVRSFISLYIFKYMVK